MFWASSCPSAGATTAAAASGLPSELGGSSAVGRGRTGRPARPRPTARGGALGWGTAIQAGRSRVRFPMVSLDFFSLTQSFRPHYGPGVDAASNRNEYQECFVEVKAAGAEGWQPYHLHVTIVLKSGSLNLLEPLGPVQACNGIALPLPLPLHVSDLSRSIIRRNNCTYVNPAHQTPSYTE